MVNLTLLYINFEVVIPVFLLSARKKAGSFPSRIRVRDKLQWESRLKGWIPSDQVRGRLSQARNDKNVKDFRRSTLGC